MAEELEVEEIGLNFTTVLGCSHGDDNVPCPGVAVARVTHTPCGQGSLVCAHHGHLWVVMLESMNEYIKDPEVRAEAGMPRCKHCGQQLDNFDEYQVQPFEDATGEDPR